MNFIDGSLFPENQEKLVDHRRAVRAGVDARRLPRGHPGHDGRADPEGGRLLQRRRHRAAPARARARRQGQQAPVEVQRADRRHPRARAGVDHPGRRLDFVRARARRRRGEVAQRRHAPHAGRTAAQAGPGDARDQHQPDERRRADVRGRPRRHVAGRAGHVPRLPRDDHSRGPRVGRGAHPAAERERHPDAFPARQHLPARDGRAHDAPWHLQRAADPDLGRDRRRLRRAEHLQPRQLRPRRAGRRRADARDVDAERAADQHDGDRAGPARALRHRGQHLDPGPQGEDDARSSRSSSSCASRASSVAKSPIAQDARRIYKLGTFYRDADETLRENGFAPNRKPCAARRCRCAPRPEPMGASSMAKAIRMHQTGAPDVLRLEDVEVGAPGPGQARLRHVAVGINFADTYFRTGPVPGRRCRRAWASRRPVSSRRWARA